MNLVVLQGNLGGDPEVRHTGNGGTVCTFRVATSARVKRGDEFVEETQWHRIVTWGKLAESCGQYLAKGKSVLVQGKLKYRSYDDKDGNKREVTEVVADEVKFLSPRGEGGGQSGGGKKKNDRSEYETPDDDSIPF